MSQLSSVERTTMIELFSTFFDRLSSHNPQRETMLKQLYQFKALMYANDVTVDKFLQDLQKSPLKRDNSQNKKSSSFRKEERQPQRTKSTITTSCGHEIEKEQFENQMGEMKCPVCAALLPITDYRQLTAFEEFKMKTAPIFKAITNFDHEDFFKVLQQLEDPMMTSLGKQRCQSSTGELFKDPMNYSRMALEDRTQINQIQQIIRKCLRCNKDVQNNDQKSISYFCNSCKNF